MLVNKLHIHDEAALQEAEALATYVNASKLEQCQLEGVFDFTHYKAIHQFLSSDLYDWAGQIRTVNISKKGTDFCPAGEIEPQAKLIFDRLKEQDYFGFIENLVVFYLENSGHKITLYTKRWFALANHFFLCYNIFRYFSIFGGFLLTLNQYLL